MSANKPLLSIIIVTRNPGRRIQDALDSVWRQVNADSELVVIDGASSDGTAEWLREKRDEIDHLSSAPDKGVYDAMNKGLRAARGAWVLFLGADDRLASPHVLAEVDPVLRAANTDVLVGIAVYEDGRKYGLEPQFSPVRRNFAHHQATFYRRNLLSESEVFDPGLVFAGDFDLNLQLWRAGCKFESTQLLVARCGSGGLSDGGSWRNYSEEIIVRHRHFPGWRCWFWDMGSIVRFFRKRLIRSRFAGVR